MVLKDLLAYWPTALTLLIICVLFYYEQKCIWEDRKEKKKAKEDGKD